MPLKNIYIICAALMIKNLIKMFSSENNMKKYDQEIPQSHTTDQPTAP